jgi:hypothetical protein
VDQRAVIALVVVLRDDLPVGRDLVGVAGFDFEPGRVVRRDELVEGAQVIGERCGGAGGVHENPAVPLHRGQLYEPVPPGLEALAHARRGLQRAGQLIGPSVVRADDGPPIAGGTGRQQFVAAVAADVGEGPDLVRLPRHQDGEVADGERLLHIEIVAPAEAGPRAGEQMALLPCEHVRADIRRLRQHDRLAERLKDQVEGVGGQRRRSRVRHPGSLTD